MSEKITQEIIKSVDHPLESFFNLPPSSTEVVQYEQKTSLVKVEDYDEKDNEIEEGIQEIADKALSAYENIQENIDDIDPKYQARSHEVANQLLTTALHAMKVKADMKTSKDKAKIMSNKTINQTKTTNNNILVTDTNSLIKQLKELGNSQAIEVIAEIKPD